MIIADRSDAVTSVSAEMDLLHLDLTVRDPEVVAALRERPGVGEREAYALAALRVGVLALRAAGGVVDAQAIREAGDELIRQVECRLKDHQQGVTTGIAGHLRAYFDQGTGSVPSMIDGLVGKGGRLQSVLDQHLCGEGSVLARTLLAHVGEGSPLLRMLSPQQKDGLLARLEGIVDEALEGQRSAILAEFDLNNEAGALARLVREAKDGRESLQEAFDATIGRLAREFSLDEEDSSLSRFKKQVGDQISALIEKQSQFQLLVVRELEGLRARREEAARGTQHGGDFQEAALSLLEDECRKASDVFQRTPNTVGLIKNCKVGDGCVELGPDCAASGARIAVEAKEDRRYDLKSALGELDTARKNRGATVGLFVCSSKTAPHGLPPVARYGNDVVVTWNAEDPASDVLLRAGLSIARALCTQEASQRSQRAVDLTEVEQAIRAVEKLAASVEEIRGWAQTIQSRSGDILDRARKMDDEIRRQVRRLDEGVVDLRSACRPDGGGT